MFRLTGITLQAFVEELDKIAAISAPSIKAPPMPGGSGVKLTSKPAAPVSPAKITSKALSSTTLQKTNYTSVGTKPPKVDVSQTMAQKVLPTPAPKATR